MTKSPKSTPGRKLPLPAGGGSFTREKDGSLRQVAGTRPPGAAPDLSAAAPEAKAEDAIKEQ
ncbi:hypothetical protein [Chelativorans alearense]|uniref:hypothetical protein n=1 Tax=Chelativorans alearense TaxID=2681495 RepID=UPI0013D343C7|nr:hypothetical protein [Chelativorans alearense]